MKGRNLKRDIGISLVAGLIFGAGLVVSGMTRPDRVIGFLDLLGGWDPTMAFVLAGATGTHMLLRPLTQRLAPEQVKAGTPTRSRLDKELLLGAALFGAGWGLGGYCPGPAVTAALPALGDTLVFGVAMVGGMALHHLMSTRNTAVIPENSPVKQR